jgi:hypothetical protein
MKLVGVDTYREIQASLVSHDLGAFAEGLETLDEELENVESVGFLGFLILRAEGRPHVLPFLEHVLGESSGANPPRGVLMGQLEESFGESQESLRAPLTEMLNHLEHLELLL